MMAVPGWSQGYVTDIPYVEGFFRELSPVWLNYVAALGGAQPRDISGPFTYAELGCGFGQSTNVLASCFPQGEFYGVDFNPAHIDTARRQASQFGNNNIQFLERSFDALSDVKLPDFDFITLHGVYVWVDSDAQAAIKKFILERLKPGGIVYISYNCLPGWTFDAPIRKWLREFTEIGSGEILSRISASVKSLKQASTVKSGYFGGNSAAAAFIEKISKQNPQYLAHEYFNAAWALPYCIDVARDMGDAKLNYVGSAAFYENSLDLCLPAEAVKFVQALPSVNLRQLAMDFFVNKRFRRDVFVRGMASLSPRAVVANVEQQIVCLTRPAKAIGEKLKFPLGVVDLKAEVVDVVKRIMAEGPQSIGDIVAKARKTLPPDTKIGQLINLLIASDNAHPFAQSYSARIPAQFNKVKWRHAANNGVAEACLRQGQTRYVINPIAGNGWPLDPLVAGLIYLLDGRTSDRNVLAKQLEELLRQFGVVVQIRKSDGDKKAADNVGSTTSDVENDDQKVKRYMIEMMNQALDQGLPLFAQMGLVELA